VSESRFTGESRVLPRRISVIALLLFAALGPSRAQSPNGTISGLVLDPSHAAIADAQIIVVNEATGTQFESKTSTQGIYILPNLPPGEYRLQVSKVGFKTLIKKLEIKK